MPDPRLTDGFATPPTLRNADGDLRSVGVEIEFSGIGTEEAAEALCAGLGGELREEGALTFVLRGSRLWDLEVKLDTAYAGSSSGSGTAKKIGARVGTFLASVAEPLIPCEVVTPPVPISIFPVSTRSSRSFGLLGMGAPRRRCCGRWRCI